MKLIFLAVMLVQFPVSSIGVQDRPLHYPIEEELPIGTVVADVKRDSGLASKYPHSQLSEFTFKFLKPRKDFALNVTTGIITTSNRLDRDVICPSQPSCFIGTDVAVYSNKNVGHVIKVLFDVIDINDNAPRFPENHISEILSEGTLPGVLFPVRQAQDADSPEYGLDHYQLIPGGPTFSLNVTRGEDGYFDLKLVLMQRLDRETKDFYQLKIIAYDKGNPPKSGTVMLHIEIQDVNDNLPVFANGTYEVEIGENFPPVQSLLSVHATDADLGDNGAVTYSFSPRTLALYGDKFSIGKYSGVISLLKALDFEEARVLPLEVEARNGGFEPVTTHVVVTVRDVNDNSPVIRIETADGLHSGSEGSPVVFVAEHCPVGTFVAHLSVTDADGGNNGQVRCSLHSPQFQLVSMYETEFKLLTAADLDREYVGLHHVVVICHDLGQSMRSTVMNITVVVDDVNDHVPALSQTFYNWSIVENNEVGALIGQVSASDPDKVFSLNIHNIIWYCMRV